MGKLVLTNRRIIFLSTGENTGEEEAYNHLFGVFGLVRQVRACMREKEIIKAVAESLAISDPRKPGGWAYDLKKLTSVRVVGGIWQRRYLRIEAFHGGGICSQGIYRLGLTRQELLALNSSIEVAMAANAA